MHARRRPARENFQPGASDGLSNTEARREVMAAFQLAVDEGRATWHASSNGLAELHLDTGEVFLLHETEVTRLI